MEMQKLLQMRKERGYKIAKEDDIVRQNGVWLVPSQSSNRQYEVVLRIDKNTCTCPDFVERGIECKYIFAVEIVTTRQVNTDGTVTVTQTKRMSYPQMWHEYTES